METKYYYAGSQRVAMRQGGTLHYLLGDHLGSTSVPFHYASGTITASTSGNRQAELRNHAYGYLLSTALPVSANTQYDLYAYVRGELDPDDSGAGWIIRAYFYDSSGKSIGYRNAASGGAGTLSTAWQRKGGRITTPAGTATVRIFLFNYLSSGWVAYDDVSLKRVGSRTNLVPNPGFEGGSGWSKRKVGAFPGTSFWRGTWGTAAPHSGRYAYAISNHAYGHLQSAALPVSANTQYDVYAYVRGELDPDDSGGKWLIRAYFYDSSGKSIGYRNAAAGGAGTLSTAWQRKGGRITTPAGTATVRISLYNFMNSGWVAYDDVSLVGPSVTTRKYYYAGSQRVAMRENGTLHYLLGDHLGSTSVTADENGNKEAELRYRAYGETRYAWGDTPTSFRFTGQREDGTIGLYFYNSRFYDPVLGRFIQADSIIPNPADPQNFNRYSYVRNNPLRYTDPSGHRTCGPGYDSRDETCDEARIDPRNDNLPSSPLAELWRLRYQKQPDAPYNAKIMVAEVAEYWFDEHPNYNINDDVFLQEVVYRQARGDLSEALPGITDADVQDVQIHYNTWRFVQDDPEWAGLVKYSAGTAAAGYIINKTGHGREVHTLMQPMINAITTFNPSEPSSPEFNVKPPTSIGNIFTNLIVNPLLNGVKDVASKSNDDSSSPVYLPVPIKDS